MSEKKRFIIGVTGPTGAGKSTVVGCLSEDFGFCAIDTDQLAREAVKLPECAASLKAQFGEDLYDEAGNLNRALLAERAFASEEKTNRLNEITHPFVIRLLMQCLEAQKSAEKFVIDVPLLYESGLDQICDCVLAVTAPYQTRLSRIRKRDHLTLAQAKLRMARQKKNSFYESRADLVLSGRSENVRADLKAALRKLQVIL